MDADAGDVVVRVAGPGDADLAAVLRVHAAHRPGTRAADPPTGQERATWRRMAATPDLTVYLAEAPGGEPIGTATLLLMPNVTYGCAPTAFIEAVVVVPAHRRRGVATAVLRRALADAAEGGCDKVQLLSHKRHATDGAHALYTSLGFSAEAEGFRRYLRSSPPPSSAPSPPAPTPGA
ncbi:MAG TPA: GNAT family N-acetyltransferase [Acidimicrobiales bacterium]